MRRERQLEQRVLAGLGLVPGIGLQLREHAVVAVDADDRGELLRGDIVVYMSGQVLCRGNYYLLLSLKLLLADVGWPLD